MGTVPVSVVQSDCFDVWLTLCSYMNYAWIEQDVLGSYGEKNVEKLRCVAEKYDPDRVWEKLVKTGFKIPRK